MKGHSMIKVLIIEDYPDEADALREALSLYAKKHNVEFSVVWSEKAQALASGEKTFDLVFLDIELPDMSGMDAATLMRSYDKGTPIIFTTSLSQYAAKSYEVDAAGFIVKPVTLPKLEMCMDKVMGSLNRAHNAKIVLPQAGGVRVLLARDIVYVELIHHDLVFHLSGDESPVKIRGTIKQVLDCIDADGPLLQVSSGCLVNMDYIQLISGNDVKMIDGAVLGVSRARKKDAIARFSSYVGRTF